eukprot:2591009-Prymnesium_polylepis.1
MTGMLNLLGEDALSLLFRILSNPLLPSTLVALSSSSQALRRVARHTIAALRARREKSRALWLKAGCSDAGPSEYDRL